MLQQKLLAQPLLLQALLLYKVCVVYQCRCMYLWIALVRSVPQPVL